MTDSPTTAPLLGTVDRAASAVRLQRALPAPAAQVWDALTDPARLHAWLAPVQGGVPGPAATFVLRMDDQETATCTVTTWNPPHELRLIWDYTDEGPSQVSIRLIELDGQTQLVLEHIRIPADAVQYGAGWHVHLDFLAAHLSCAGRTVDGCDDESFLAAYRTLEPRYAATATG
jgi:uncharacterized protein YndB with AHSA1/START domain